MKSIDWRSNRFVFKFYLGLDKADELYDTGDEEDVLSVGVRRNVLRSFTCHSEEESSVSLNFVTPLLTSL